MGDTQSYCNCIEYTATMETLEETLKEFQSTKDKITEKRHWLQGKGTELNELIG